MESELHPNLSERQRLLMKNIKEWQLSTLGNSLSLKIIVSLGVHKVMLYLTRKPNDDPFFDARSLRPDYNDRVETFADVQSQPIDGVDFTADYRVHVRYTLADLPSYTVLRVELLLTRSTEDWCRGRPQLARLPAGLELCLVPFLAWDAEHGPGREQVLDKIEQHQAERDDELADRMGAAS